MKERVNVLDKKYWNKLQRQGEQINYNYDLSSQYVLTYNGKDELLFLITDCYAPQFDSPDENILIRVFSEESKQDLSSMTRIIKHLLKQKSGMVGIQIVSLKDIGLTPQGIENLLEI